MTGQKAHADQPPPYAGLLDQLARIDPSAFQDNWQPLTEKPISDNNPLELLLLAETAMQRQYWSSAAALFVRTMLAIYTDRYAETELVEHASKVILAVRKRPSSLQHRADLYLYCHKRVAEALGEGGVKQPDIDEWMHLAFRELARSSVPHKKLLEKAHGEIVPWSATIGTRYRRDAGHAHSVLSRVLHTLPGLDQIVQLSRKHELRNLACLFVGVVAIILIAFCLRGLVSYPLASTLFLGCNLLGMLLVAWPPLLLATWLFAGAESKRTRAFRFISPEHFIRDNSAIVGEIVPFRRDWFFHIFQFVWLPVLAIQLILLKKYQELPAALPKMAKTASTDPKLGEIVNSLGVSFTPDLAVGGNLWHQARLFFSSDFVVLAIALGVACGFMLLQVRIQRRRKKIAKNLFWWDRRISPCEWRVRFAMVGLDVLLAVILLFKTWMIGMTFTELLASDVLAVQYFAPDGIGGLKFIADIFTTLSWLVLLYGFFVMASMYLHRNLEEYRVTDAILVFVYLVVFALAMTLLQMFEFRLDEQKDALTAGLQRPAYFTTLADAAKYVKDVAAMREWRVSIHGGLFSNPVLLLMLQGLWIAVQYLYKAGALPNLPIPGLSSPAAAKGTTDGQ